MKPQDADPKRPKLTPLIHNRLSFAGIIVASCSFFAIFCLIAIDFFGGFRNQYVGILTYIVSPAFMMAGLLLILGGALRERHRRRKLQPGETPAYPRLDLNVPRQRRVVFIVCAIMFVLLLLTAVGSYRTYQYTESVQFCGTACHSVMGPEYTAYQQSPHASVACVECHIGPKPAGYVQSKLKGASRLYATLLNKYPRPIPPPIGTVSPVRLTCQQCHWSKKYFGSTEKVWHHYLPDKTNTDWTIRMLLKVGGGDATFGPVGGIHWHMAVANKVEFIATDKQMQVIPWVRVTDSKGKVTVYQSKDDPLKPAQIAGANIQVMNCVDCHNRPAHRYHTPVEAVDLAMSTGRISPKLPFIKQEAAEVLTNNFSSVAEAFRNIKEALTSYYRTNYPGVDQTNSALIAQAVHELDNIYSHNFFPRMKVNWRDYPNNIGHLDFPGCFRCHDGRHVSASGRTITRDCRVCHDIISQGDGAAPQSVALKGLSFKHPVDVNGAWQDYNCTFCHDGGVVSLE